METLAIGASRRKALCIALAAILAPDPLRAAAPSIGLFGSFFPSWLLCLLLGVVATVVLRVVFVVSGIDDILQWRVPVYMLMALGLTCLFSLLLFGR